MKAVSVAGLAVLALVSLFSCSNPTTSTMAAAGDVSPEMVALAADLNTAQITGLQASFTDESAVTTETSTTVAARTVASSSSVSVTVVHSVTTLGSFATYLQAGDVVTVTRTWTNGQGEAVSDVVVRPRIPVAADFTPTVTTPYTAGAGVSAVYAAGPPETWTLTGTETKTVNGIVFGVQVYKLTYQWDSVHSRVELLSIAKSGEKVNLFSSKNSLTTTIYYNYAGTRDQEFLRITDLIGAQGILKRQVYAWDVNPSFATSAATEPPLTDLSLTSGTTTASALTFAPALAVESGASTVDFWYESDPSAVLPANPVYSGTSLATYPVIDISQWTGSVLQESGPRIADWYKPVATSNVFTGKYVRRYEITFNGGPENNRKVFSLADGTTLVNPDLVCLTYQTAANGTVTTTKTFSDGITSKVTITPTTDPTTGSLTGYVIVRGPTTFTLTYVLDGTGDVSSVTVTNSTTAKTVTYTEGANGTFSAS